METEGGRTTRWDATILERRKAKAETQSANRKSGRTEHFKDERRDKRYAVGNRASRGDDMDLRCPQCNSTDVKKVSLAYQEGFSQLKTHSRLRAIAVGSDGPDVIVGRITSRGTAQTELSRILSPPRKWSYRKLQRYWLFGFVVGSWVVIAFDWNKTNSQIVISIPFLAFAAACLGVFAVLASAFWKHNRWTFPKEYARWNRSFVCNKCGEVSEQNL